MPQLPGSHSNSQGLNRSNPLTNSLTPLNWTELHCTNWTRHGRSSDITPERITQKTSLPVVLQLLLEGPFPINGYSTVKYLRRRFIAMALISLCVSLSNVSLYHNNISSFNTVVTLCKLNIRENKHKIINPFWGVQLANFGVYISFKKRIGSRKVYIFYFNLLLGILHYFKKTALSIILEYNWEGRYIHLGFTVKIQTNFLIILCQRFSLVFSWLESIPSRVFTIYVNWSDKCLRAINID
jgi:hypothetical protein